VEELFAAHNPEHIKAAQGIEGVETLRGCRCRWRVHMGHEYMKFNKLTTFCRKNTAAREDQQAEGRGKVLESSYPTQDRFFIT
jgi:hypothetical protein